MNSECIFQFSQLYYEFGMPCEAYRMYFSKKKI